MIVKCGITCQSEHAWGRKIVYAQISKKKHKKTNKQKPHTDKHTQKKPRVVPHV